jgi:hypothetical protein
MKPLARWSILGATGVGLVVLFLLLRPGGAGNGVSPTPSTSPTQGAERTVVDVTFRDGAVQGPARSTVTQGERVRIVVHADVTDEIHLHGYDLLADVSPSDPARIDFVANAAGVFECELHHAGKLLFRLEIVP